MKVFIIDDSSYVRTQINGFLRELGFSDIVGFPNYLKFEEEAEKQNPDLIFINIDPEIPQSFEALDRIKSKYFSKIVILYHIGQNIEHIIEGKYKGIKILSKPISKRSLSLIASI